MAIDMSNAIGVEVPASEQVPGAPGELPPDRRRGFQLPALFGPGLLRAGVFAVLGYLLGHWFGNLLASGYQQVTNSGDNNTSIILGYLGGTIGWVAGIGVLAYPLFKMTGKEELLAPQRRAGTSRYFKYTLDHKVVGIQYMVGMIVYFLTAGLLALAVRTELLSPTSHVFGPGVYIEIVGEHGTMMMMMMTSVVVGPFGNYLVPLMIGAKRMAFPRLEALSFWLTPAAYVILLSSLWLGGFPTGWTGYATLSIQAGQGMDAYVVAFGVMAVSIILAGFNIIVTVINLRAPGLTWGRLPVFVWGVMTTSFLMVLATPVLFGGLYMLAMDRTVQTSFFTDTLGGSSYLWENLFWFFGHPEVYILALPGFAIVLEMLPVFCRKPIFAQKVAIAGMVGVSSLSFFVWQHHLFDSGINPDMRPLFMLTTELISIPTGFIFLVGMGTLWKARIRLTVPMMFCMGFFFNFLLGGISGVFLSDVPADTTAHGSFFVMAHFHYTIMGGLLFAFFGGLYYWLPKMTGRTMNQRLGKWNFITMFVFFNSTFLPLFAVGELGQPRRVFEYAKRLQTLNDWVSISAFLLGFAILLFVINLVWSMIIKPVATVENPWHSRGLEWQTTSPPPPGNFERIPIVLASPYEYGNPEALPVSDLLSPGRAPVAANGANTPTGQATTAGPDTERTS
ncbi:cbb3-type cytochrome c oxidase subunit I [Acidiferrimicrobium sp. IK]|uniref:cytochrome c oxidase subunit I n=1 Tax=Acidiferrimicrobium sp. IK TaxID=2871700 RepID=UPI0021CB2969|nr:cbb3-type cytochrome c oxidase subunit I [Acidiferrimicrobium sp. IK]MCU4186688.1 cbb3-type cytochrome c oxidase subunit I [Acidiferrimicrobium sp. IK]